MTCGLCCDRSRLMKYVQKLDDFRDTVTTTDTATAVRTEIKDVEERIASLKEKSICIPFSRFLTSRDVT